MVLAERLVGEARARRARSMDAGERRVLGISATLFVIAALLVALLVPSEREANPLLMAGLVAAYFLASRVHFEFGCGYVAPEQLVIVPMLLLVPLPYVPILIAAAGAPALVPDFVRGRWARDRWLNPMADCWPCLAPVLVLAAFAPGPPELSSAGIYLLALLAQLAADFAQTTLRNRLLDQVPLGELTRAFSGSARVDLVLSPVALAATLAAADEPLFLFVVLGPLGWLLDNFAKDRWARYAAALELNRAYRGTVMVLSDVLEFEDHYTAEHSRSVVELVNATADELGLASEDRQELEFAAMLHDVGKISIPKVILHKPSALTDGEFEIVKGHTVEGQFMLDRVGGLLGRVGEVVRSCHERWDGKGYPDGLKGREIPLAARIVFVCDAYNAMTTDRPYRSAMQPRAALDELLANAGSQFDPKVVSAVAAVVARARPAISAADEVRAVLASRPVSHSVRAAG